MVENFLSNIAKKHRSIQSGIDIGFKSEKTNTIFKYKEKKIRENISYISEEDLENYINEHAYFLHLKNPNNSDYQNWISAKKEIDEKVVSGQIVILGYQEE